MSVEQMSKVWKLDLEPNHKIILLAYADHADDDGDNVYPSLGRMAHKTGYSVDQVRRISRQLVEDDLMQLVERGQGRGNPHRYRLTLEKGSSLPPFKPKEKGGKASEKKVASGSEKGGTAVPPEPSSPETSVEPPVVEEFANAHSSSGKPQSAEGESSQDKTVPVEKYVTDRIYETALGSGYRQPNESYPYHLGRAKDMLAKDSPTDDEIEDLPAAFVRLFEIKGKADAPSALVELRRQRGREKILADSERPAHESVHPQSDVAQIAKDKPRRPEWYASLLGGDPSAWQRRINNGATHSELMEAGHAA